MKKDTGWIPRSSREMKGDNREITDDNRGIQQEIKIFSMPNDLFQFAAQDFCERAMIAVKDKGLFSVVLSGGHTPQLLFDTLSETEYYKNNIPWGQIQFFFGDERYVPFDNEKSNYHMACDHLFSKVPINPNNIYPIPTQFDDPKDAAKAYENTLRKVFHSQDNAFPQFDLFYLGLGENGHTASLMPFSDVVIRCVENPLSEKNNQLAAAIFDSETNMYRITLTPNAINNAQEIIFLVTGANKKNALRAVREGKTNPLLYPAQLIQSIHGKTIWYLDEAAAGSRGPAAG